MKELTERKKLQILRFFLEGYTYDDISTKNGVAKGTVVNIVNDFRAGRFPALSDVSDLVDTLRELSVELRRRGAGVPEAMLGLAFFSRLDEMGVKPPDVWTWAEMCRELSPPQALLEEFMNAALEFFRLKQETGESYPSLVARCSGMWADADSLRLEVEQLRKEKEELQSTNATLAEEREELSKKRKGLGKDVGQLSSNRERLRLEVTELEEKRSTLGDEVKELETTAEGLRPEVSALYGLGFGKNEMEMLKLAEVASSHGISADELRVKFF
ncbi:MAG: helix-turn-helix domain-containing protein [Dehalococcoidia bacterium]|nr:helix-turn-helix domain-containing protein [Dehalococcoidia bacterium]